MKNYQKLSKMAEKKNSFHIHNNSITEGKTPFTIEIFQREQWPQGTQQEILRSKNFLNKEF